MDLKARLKYFGGPAKSLQEKEQFEVELKKSLRIRTDFRSWKASTKLLFFGFVFLSIGIRFWFSKKNLSSRFTHRKQKIFDTVYLDEKNWNFNVSRRI